VSVNEALRVLRARWRVTVLCLLLAVLGAAVVTASLPRQYTSDVTLYVSLQGEAADSDSAYQASQLAKERVVSYAPLLKDERITQPVIDRLQLGVTPAQLASRITVTVQPDTVVLSAAVTDTSPERAAAIANALAEEFVGLVNDLEQPIGSRASTTPGQPAPPPPAKIGVQIIRPATPNPVAVSPNSLFNLALGAALGLLLGIGAAFLRNARDTTVRAPRRIEALAGAPVLASVAADRDARRHPVTLGAHPGSAQVEAYRKLRTNLLFLEPGKPHRVIVVTSPSVGEGKSTAACNLALALADAGNRVVLIDVNLRRPQVEQYLGIGPTAGVVNVLAGRIPLRRAVGRWVEGGLDVLTAGPVPFNPSELLASRATAALLDEVRQHYDFVILDTPAILPVTDAATVAARADGVVLVVRYGRTVEEQVTGAVTALDAVQAPLLGVVLMGTPGSRRRRRRAGAYPEPDRTLLPPRNAGPSVATPQTSQPARPAVENGRGAPADQSGRPAGQRPAEGRVGLDQPTEILVLPTSSATGPGSGGPGQGGSGQGGSGQGGPGQGGPAQGGSGQGGPAQGGWAQGGPVAAGPSTGGAAPTVQIGLKQGTPGPDAPGPNGASKAGAAPDQTGPKAAQKGSAANRSAPNGGGSNGAAPNGTTQTAADDDPSADRSEDDGARPSPTRRG
jgi:capsular exopolysaccharide synthesis family protein